MGYFDNLNTVDTRHGVYSAHGDKAQWAVDCPVCGAKRMLAIAEGKAPSALKDWNSISGSHSAWLMCVACGMGAFAVGTHHDVDYVFPRPKPFDVPGNLSDEVSKTWNEALLSYTATAFTSCALMCRKIIFHMAVEAGLGEKKSNGFAPNFTECINFLVKEELITKRQKDQWVDSIREWGNTATHDLAPIDQDTAHNALEFTHQLLQMVYAFPNAAPGSKEEQGTEVEPAPRISGVSH